jgi:hypothetical protein
MFYQNTTRGVLERATWAGVSLGNCGFNSIGSMTFEWQCDTIDSMDGSPLRGISVARDAHNHPVVAYQFGLDPGPAALGVARPVASPEVDEAGNCGPGSSWYCEIVDVGAYFTEAGSVSIAIQGTGEATVAYHEWDDYNWEHNLKTATKLPAWIFADGFDKGDTIAWSATVP